MLSDDAVSAITMVGQNIRAAIPEGWKSVTILIHPIGCGVMVANVPDEYARAMLQQWLEERGAPDATIKLSEGEA